MQNHFAINMHMKKIMNAYTPLDLFFYDRKWQYEDLLCLFLNDN